MSSEKQLYIGRSVTRLEDPPLVTGRGRFAGDIDFPHMLHMRIVRSPMAHGTIRGIDTAEARALPGVVAVWTAADIADLPLIEFREGPIESLAAYRQPVLARDCVRYVGEPVAAIFAEDPYVAEDAADLVTIDLDELPVIITADAPVGEFEPGRPTEATIVRQGYGEVDAAFQDAHAVIELDLTVGRHSGVPLETRGAIGRYDAARDVLEMHGAAKVPHKNREALARMFGRPLSAMHLYEGQTGGGFGIRGELYPEDVLVCYAAMQLERPVKWIEDRREHLIAANHSRQQRHLIRTAIDSEGRILAIDDELFHDQGAYLRTHGVRVPHMICGILPGPYRIPAYRAAARVRLTNKTPAATYRAPGRFETTFVRERVIDAIALKLGLDPLEVRRRNLITKEEMPYPRPLQALGEEIFYDSGDYAGLIDKTMAAIGWDALQADLKRRRDSGEMVGIGMSVFVEKGGLGPRDGAIVSVDPTGTAEVVTGGSSIGQGFDTVIAQVCAEMLGIDYRRVRVVRGRTDRIAYGIGAHASRATVMTASATRVAALKVRDKALDLAAELLQTPVDRLDIVDGQIVRKGGETGPSISIGEIAGHLSPTSKHLGSRDPGLSAEGWHHSENQVYPYGVHVAVVKVDPDTGGIAIERHFVGYDIGRAINPMLVEGQIVGGFTQGMGGSLYEEFIYDDNGEPLAVTFADYLMPTAHETPPVTVVLREDEPSPRNPLGIKSAGEAGVTGVGGAVASAIDQAIGMPGAVTRLPVTPQRMKVLLRTRQMPAAAE